MSSIFHYTDSAGLLGILSSESLFATDYRYLNDFSEGNHLRELIMPIFEAEVRELTLKLIEKDILMDRALDHIIQADFMYNAILRATNTVSPVFDCSFCKHVEGSYEATNGLLSQWRGYSGMGGFAIEFDEERVDDLLIAEGKEYVMFYKSNDVLYDNFANAFDSEVYKGVAGEIIRGTFQHLGLNVEAITGRKNIDEVVAKFLQLAPFL